MNNWSWVVCVCSVVGWAVTARDLCAQGVRATVHGDVYRRQQVVSVPVIEGEVGEVAFDPTDENRLYLLVDAEVIFGGGVYRLDEVDGMLVLGEQLVSADRPSSIAFTQDGDLWFLRDFGAAGGYLLRILGPGRGPPHDAEVVISNFQTPADDDPKVLGIAPTGFASDLVQPGDLVIAEAGADDDRFNAFYVFSPSSAIELPVADHAKFLVSPGALAQFDGLNVRDFDFSKAGDAIFALYASGDIIPIGPDGSIGEKLTISGVDTSTATAMAVSPLDGRIWLGIDSLAELWSVDPSTGAALREIEFTRLDEGWPLAPIRFHPPSLEFSPDGRRLVVTDSLGQLWVFDALEPSINNPPSAQIRNNFPGQVIALTGDRVSFELDGSASDDGDGGAQGLQFEWSQLPGQQFAEIEASGASARVAISKPGIYVFALEVDDGQPKDNTSTSQLALGVLAMQANGPHPFETVRLVPMGGVAGDAAFDPVDGRLYALLDDLPEVGGGVYEVLNEAGELRRGRKIAPLDRPSSLAFTPNGDLWVVRDFSAAQGPYLAAIRRPSGGAPFTVEPIITGFAGTPDDDPFAVVVVPQGFSSANAAPGDLLILDQGADGNDYNAIYVFSPSSPRGNPAAFGEMFWSAAQLAGYTGTNLNDLAFSRDGSRLFVGSAGGSIIELDPKRNLSAQLALQGAPIFSAGGMAVDPQTGRLWVTDFVAGQVLSVNLETEEATPEIQFSIQFPGVGRLPIDLHSPSLTFSPDGRTLVMSDAGNRGWLWVFERPRAPEPLFRRGDAEGSGEIDLSDPVFVLNHLFLGGRAPDCLDAADGDDSGVIDISDGVFLLSFLFLGGPAPPPPGPTDCGNDPSADSLDCAAGCR